MFKVPCLAVYYCGHLTLPQRSKVQMTLQYRSEKSARVAEQPPLDRAKLADHLLHGGLELPPKVADLVAALPGVVRQVSEKSAAGLGERVAHGTAAADCHPYADTVSRIALL